MPRDKASSWLCQCRGSGAKKARCEHWNGREQLPTPSGGPALTRDSYRRPSLDASPTPGALLLLLPRPACWTAILGPEQSLWVAAVIHSLAANLSQWRSPPATPPPPRQICWLSRSPHFFKQEPRWIRESVHGVQFGNHSTRAHLSPLSLRSGHLFFSCWHLFPSLLKMHPAPGYPPFRLSQLPDHSYWLWGDPIWAKDGAGKCEMRPLFIVKPTQDRVELMMERYQVQITLSEPLRQVFQKSEIPLDFSDKELICSFYCLTQFGLGFHHMRPNRTTTSRDTGDSPTFCPKNSLLRLLNLVKAAAWKRAGAREKTRKRNWGYQGERRMTLIWTLIIYQGRKPSQPWPKDHLTGESKARGAQGTNGVMSVTKMFTDLAFISYLNGNVTCTLALISLMYAARLPRRFSPQLCVRHRQGLSSPLSWGSTNPFISLSSSLFTLPEGAVGRHGWHPQDC